MKLYALQRLVNQGEGELLEFKRKAHHPDKIAKEVVAFANSKGGRLLIGVDDDLTIYGSKDAQGDAFALQKYWAVHIQPAVDFELIFVPVNAQRSVLLFEIQAGPDKPYYLLDKSEEKVRKQAYIRVKDMSIAASRMMASLLWHSRRKKGVNFSFGDRERQLLQLMEGKSLMSLDEIKTLMRMPKRKISGMLITLIRAGLIQIEPSQKGDFFCLAEEAFIS